MPSLGRIDALTVSGFVEGWALRRERGFRPLLVAVITPDGKEVASGLANLYREDLVAAGLGTGWNAFRLKLGVPSYSLRRSRLQLHDVIAGDIIAEAENLNFVSDSGSNVTDFEKLSDSDPFVLRDIAQIKACEGIFADYIRRHGVGQFVRVAYLYVLGRPVDATGLTLYSKLLRRNMLSPFSLLQELSASDEFKIANRTLVSPSSSNFAFASS